MEISYLGKANFKLKTKTGVVLTSDDQVSVLHKGETGNGFVINQPGEYEIEGISVFGYQNGEGVVYVIQTEELRCLYLGEHSKPLVEKISGEIENIDIVIVPTDSMSVKEATELSAKLEPYYVLPFGEGTTKFIASYEHGSRSVKSLNIAKATLPEDLTEVIVFE